MTFVVSSSEAKFASLGVIGASVIISKVVSEIQKESATRITPINREDFYTFT